MKYSWQRQLSTAITLAFSFKWSFRNHFNMLIWCLRNIYCHYHCWKQ